MSQVGLWKCDVCGVETRTRSKWVRVEVNMTMSASPSLPCVGGLFDLCSAHCAGGLLFGKTYEWQQEQDRLRGAKP